MRAHDVWLCDDGEHVRYEAGEVFFPAHPGIALRVVHVQTGEPIEPGTSGRVMLPNGDQYRLETTNAETGETGETGERGRPFLDRVCAP